MMPRVGRIIQVDRLIFDTRNSELSSSFEQKNESYVFIPSEKMKIIRLTHEDLNQSPRTIQSVNEEVISPIYESIDERRNSMEKATRLETLC